MASVAILDIMSAGKREELVRKSRTAPGKSSNAMALLASCAQTPLHMIGLCGCLVLGQVAVDTINSQGFEPE